MFVSSSSAAILLESKFESSSKTIPDLTISEFQNPQAVPISDLESFLSCRTVSSPLVGPNERPDGYKSSFVTIE